VDEASQGLAVRDTGAIWDPMQPWHAPNRTGDRRNSPNQPSGRVMRHPALAPIVYARTPDRTFNFNRKPIRGVRSVLTRTLGGTVVTRFLDHPWDVVIEERWVADGASTTVEMFDQFQKYLTTPLQTGDYIGWQPGDLSPQGFFIELLQVILGDEQGGADREAIGKRPFMMRRDLIVRFKVAFEARGPAGIIAMIGN
jgi:hypothetical protein